MNLSKRVLVLSNIQHMEQLLAKDNVIPASTLNSLSVSDQPPTAAAVQMINPPPPLHSSDDHLDSGKDYHHSDISEIIVEVDIGSGLKEPIVIGTNTDIPVRTVASTVRGLQLQMFLLK